MKRKAEKVRFTLIFKLFCRKLFVSFIKKRGKMFIGGDVMDFKKLVQRIEDHKAEYFKNLHEENKRKRERRGFFDEDVSIGKDKSEKTLLIYK